MKIKMFKKVLAAVLAASSVMAMSGVAMAVKKAPGNGKSYGASKNPAKSGRKVMKLKRIKEKDEGKNKKYKRFKKKEGFMATKKIGNASNAPSSSPLGDTYTAVMGEEDMLSESCCNDAFVLNITEKIDSLRCKAGKMRILKDCPKGKEFELLNALIKWANSENVTVKKNIVRAISNLAEEGHLFFDRLLEKKSDLLGAIVACSNRDPSTKPNVAWAFRCLIDCGVVSEYEDSSDVLKLGEISKEGIIEKTTRVAPASEHLNDGPRSTLVLTEGMSAFVFGDSMDIDNNKKDDDEESRFDCATEHFYTAMMGEEDMLSESCCNDKFVLEITNQIRRLKHTHGIRSLKDCRKGKESELVDALINWAKSDNITVKRNIVVAIGDLAQEGFFGDLPQEKKSGVLGALVNCVDRDPSFRSDVAWAFKRLVECGFVNENENSEEVLKLQKILNDCKDSCDVEPHLDVDDPDSDSCEI